MVGVLDQTYAAISALQQAASPEQVCDRLTSFTRGYGLTSVLAGTSPRSHALSKTSSPAEDVSHALAWSYPPEWIGRYVERGYARVDPIITRIEHDLSPFHWADAQGFASSEDKTKINLLMGEAAEFGLKDGVVIPLLTLDGTVAAVSLGGEKVDIPPQGLGVLNLVASFAMARAIELRSVETRREEIGLTKRELECLKWVADGKSEWEIGAILSISEHTADKHLSNARRKLRAVTGAQAVARALKLGLLP